MDKAVEIKDVTMRFNMSKERLNSAKEYMIKFFQKKLFFEEFIALKNINLDINKGEVVGFIGLNGSGKSTLLKTISGIYKPTSGSVKVYGTIAPLIELGAGFDMELTARENIFLNGAVLGYQKKFIEKVFDEIVEFTELHEFLDAPMKNYSSGMVARIGFAIATIVKPDILIVDEILSVGDFLFQEKCEKKIKSLMESGITVILVSHAIEQVERLCQRAVWIEKGEIKMDGPMEVVCTAYKNLAQG